VILQSVAARQFALGETGAAERTLDELVQIDPRTSPKRLYPSPPDVRIALRLLDFEPLSVWLRSETSYRIDDYGIARRMSAVDGMDLGLEFQTGAFLNRDFTSYMLQREERTYSTSPAMYRAWRRGFFPDVPDLKPFVPAGPILQGHSAFGVLNLFAWDEVHRLSICHGLSNRVAGVIIKWADEGTTGWFDYLFAPREEMADALRKVILMGRHNAGTLVDGKPAGQVALQLLQTRFGDTKAAATTKYWYFQDHGCRG
jgi:hypothetical protein